MKRTVLAPIEQWSTYNQIIDVRTPAEFAEDHMPGAINCPVLSNEERITVGTLYKQVSPFEANKVGAACVARNIAHHLEHQFAQYDKSWQPLVYCWRGGNRSGAMTHILRQVGWQASQLQGGYKAYRRAVVADLAVLPSQFQFVVLSGATGSAKTALLEALARQGAQVLNLEALAMHKGSVLGLTPGDAQPAQKGFESSLWHALCQFKPGQPVFVESESKKIGVLHLPDSLYQAMVNSPHVVQVQASLQDRVDFLLHDYRHFIQNSAALKTQLSYLKALHGNQTLAAWCEQIDRGDWFGLVENLLTQHYDPAYTKSIASNYLRDRAAVTCTLQGWQPEQLDRTASDLLAALNPQLTQIGMEL